MRFLKSASMLAVAIGLSAPIAVRAEAARSYEIEAQDLATALRIFARTSGRDVIAATEIVAGKRGQAMRGTLEPADALDRLLAGTGLKAILVDGSFVIRPTVADSDDATRSDAIVVTGTRIRGSAPVGSPVVTIDRNAIDTSGRATVAEMVESIPQNFGGGASEGNVGPTTRGGAGFNLGFGSSINLRGLGTSSTLVLFDGVRPALAGQSGAFVDTSLIPASAIDRIELLTDGASAIYGTDAVAGVVNLRFREKFQGFETRVRAATADGDYGDYKISQLAGQRWSNGGVVLAVEYSERGRLAGTSRRFVTEDLRPFGGPDLRSNLANPGTIVAANGQIFGIPTGQDGTRLTRADLISGQQNRTDYQKLYDILPQQRSWSAYAAADQEIADDVSLYVRAVAAQRDFEARARSITPSASVAVPITNAFYVDPIGTRQAIRVNYDFSRDFGVETMRGRSRVLSVSGGLRGSLAGWTLELTGAYGRSSENNDRTGVINTTRLAAALADSNRATAFNVFGDGSFTNPATLARVLGAYFNSDDYENWSTALRADGTLLNIPAGAAKLAFGVEHREERFEQLTIADRGATVTRTRMAGLPGSRRANAVYAELLVPLLAGDTFPGKLDLSLAGRVERYNDVGETENPKAGISWTPVPGLTARASYGTSFRAPLFIENPGQARNLYQPVALPDPASATGSTNVLALVGSPEKVGPERASTYTFGIDLKPRAIPGLTATATYFRIDYRDRVSTPGDNLFSYLVQRDVYAPLINDAPSAALIASYYNDPLFQNPSAIPASAIKAIVNAYQQNLARTIVTGIDFDLGYMHALGEGTASIGLSGTRLLGLDQQITATSPAIDLSGAFGGPVKLRMRGRASWSGAGFDASAYLNYTDGYTNPVGTTVQQVASWTTVDVQLGIRLPVPRPANNFRLSLSATNVFDRDPPYVNYKTVNSALAYDPEHASAVGRVIALQAIVGW
jgi:outer membrane receptor protein involved in Fe transport